MLKKYDIFAVILLLVITIQASIVFASSERQIPVTDKVQIQYLGVGGYLIDYDGYKIVFAPSFSNPSYTELAQSVFSGELKANKKAIDSLYPINGRDDPTTPDQNVSAILVGHAHYDHLLDVPHIMQTHSKYAKAYGSKTMQSILLTVGIEPDKIITLNDQLSDNKSYDKSKWQYVSNNRIRFMAINASHAPHVGNITFAGGSFDGKHLNETLDVNEWRLGQTYAFVVDFLDENQNIVYRLHYADAASEAPNGFLPDAMLKEKSVDLAILCLAGFSKVDGYPQDIVKHLNPKQVIVGHWEHFFGNLGKKPSPVSGSNQQDFLKQLKQAIAKDSQWQMPEPMTKLTFSLPNEHF